MIREDELVWFVAENSLLYLRTTVYYTQYYGAVSCLWIKKTYFSRVALLTGGFLMTPPPCRSSRVITLAISFSIAFCLLGLFGPVVAGRESVLTPSMPELDRVPPIRPLVDMHINVGGPRLVGCPDVWYEDASCDDEEGYYPACWADGTPYLVQFCPVYGVACEAEEDLFRRGISGLTSYTIMELPFGRSYELQLLFCEPGGSSVAPGQRVFDVSLNGERVVSDYDIALQAAEFHTAVTLTLQYQMPITSTDLVIGFRAAEQSLPPVLSALVLRELPRITATPSLTPTATPDVTPSITYTPGTPTATGTPTVTETPGTPTETPYALTWLLPLFFRYPCHSSTALVNGVTDVACLGGVTGNVTVCVTTTSPCSLALAAWACSEGAKGLEVSLDGGGNTWSAPRPTPGASQGMGYAIRSALAFTLPMTVTINVDLIQPMELKQSAKHHLVVCEVGPKNLDFEQGGEGWQAGYCENPDECEPAPAVLEPAPCSSGWDPDRERWESVICLVTETQWVDVPVGSWGLHLGAPLTRRGVQISKKPSPPKGWIGNGLGKGSVYAYRDLTICEGLKSVLLDVSMVSVDHVSEGCYVPDHLRVRVGAVGCDLGETTDTLLDISRPGELKNQACAMYTELDDLSLRIPDIYRGSQLRLYIEFAVSGKDSGEQHASAGFVDNLRLSSLEAMSASTPIWDELQ